MKEKQKKRIWCIERASPSAIGFDVSEKPSSNSGVRKQNQKEKRQQRRESNTSLSRDRRFDLSRTKEFDMAICYIALHSRKTSESLHGYGM